MSIRSAISLMDNRQFYGVLISTVLLVTAATLSYGFLPQFKKYQKEQAVRSGLASNEASTHTLESQLKQKDEAISQRAQELHGDAANLPAREIEAFVIDRLQDLAWSHGVVLEGVKPESGQEVEPFQELLFKLEVRGHYNQLFEWLQELRKELGFIVIKEYRMNRVDQAQTNPELRAQITFASYRRESP